MVSLEAVKKILGLRKRVDVATKEMANNLEITFFPHLGDVKSEVVNFGAELEKVFYELGVKLIPYKEALKSPSLKDISKRFFLFFAISKRIKRSLGDRNKISEFRKPYYKNFFHFVFGRKIKRGIAIIALGEGRAGGLPIDFTTSFKENPIITILYDEKVNEPLNFKEHMEKALNLFTWNMTNLAIVTDGKSWMIYSFNLSNPIFPFDKNFKDNVLNSLIPKIAAPVAPPYLNEFIILKDDFDADDIKYKPFINDLVESGKLFEKIGLYPAGRKVDSLKFRNYFYRWIGAIHLDERNGMSYGFLARQLPVDILEARLLENVEEELFNELKNTDIANYKNNLYLKIVVRGRKIVVRVPEVWVLTSRSGANKTSLDPKRDIIKMGLINGQMFLSLPRNFSQLDDYRPSFDTRVILSHAVSNAIFASVLAYLMPNSSFPKILQHNGFAIAHWHGYMNPKFIPEGFIVYGKINPSVSCSSPQSAIYAFLGKKNGIINEIIPRGLNYKGDIHIEPHHGANIVCNSLQALCKSLISNSESAALGDCYFRDY